MPANTPGGLPYPLNTEPIANGAQAIQNLALALDGRAARISSGVVTLNLTNDVTLAVAVTFPAGRFNGPPAVVGTTNNSIYNASSSSRTATGVTLTVRHQNGTAATTAVQVSWIARQEIS